MARMTSWSTWVTVAWNSFGTYLNEIWMEVVLAGSKRRLPCRAVEKGETASVPSGTGIENWEPGTTASCAARRRRSNESIAARDVAHSALYSCGKDGDDSELKEHKDDEEGEHCGDGGGDAFGVL